MKSKTQVKKRTTLDQKHIEKITELKNKKDSLPIKRETLESYTTELKTTKDIHRKSELIDLIKNTKEEINSIENCSESLKYISKTLPLLINYYESIESDKSELYENYLEITSNTHKAIKNKKICECKGEIFSQEDGLNVCKGCGLSEKILSIEKNKPSYNEHKQNNTSYVYKRKNHLVEVLSQLQAKECTEIPSSFYYQIKREMKRRKINKEDLDIFRLKSLLKRLNQKKYIEHAPYILQIINGKEPPNFTRENEKQIKKMFNDIQKPFTKHCPKNRKNFLNYSYILHKFCELLQLDEYINYFPLLKNVNILIQHDKIWQKICKDMKWQFFKSI